MADGVNATEWVYVGERLREARKREHLSLRELANRVGVSASHISQVERGLASLSVPVLYAIVAELDLTMDSLFEDRSVTKPSSVDFDEGADQNTPLDAAGIVQRSGNRPTITMANGKKWQRLTSSPLPGAEFLEVVYDPSGVAEQDSTFIRHLGHEYGLVLEGELTVQVGFDQARLRAGDSIHFDSNIPHRFWNSSSERTRAAWFILEEAGGGLGHHLTGSDPTDLELPFARALTHTDGEAGAP